MLQLNVCIRFKINYKRVLTDDSMILSWCINNAGNDSKYKREYLLLSRTTNFCKKLTILLKKQNEHQ